MKQFFRDNPGENSDSKSGGIATSISIILIIFALIAGGVIGLGLARTQVFGNGSNPPNGSSTITDSELQNLERRVSLLENLRMTGANPETSVDNLWPVDEIYQYAENSVVEIGVTKTSQGFYREEQTGTGSGFVYDSSGHIITNHHVVEGADEILVKFYNGEVDKAKIVGADPYSDLAVVKVDPEGLSCSLSPLSLGNSSDLETGDRIVAIGNPFGLEGTTTSGIVSQTGRVLSSGNQYLIPGVIQIDASINPGNSGGPLLNMAGEVIGVTSAIESQTGTFSGIGYAVPSDLLEKVGKSLIEKGEYNYPWLGISGQNVNYETAQERGLEKVQGFLVESIKQETPSAEKIREEDIVLEIDGEKVEGIGDILTHLALEKAPGDEVSLKILREGEKTSVTVELGVRPSP